MDEGDLVEVLTAASAAATPLLIEGGGSRAHIGAPPPPGARTVDLSAFQGVIDYEPSELVITAKAATPLAEIQTLLLQQRQTLAFEPPLQGWITGRAGAVPTLGGAIAANAAGPRRLTAGAARDHFLGCRAVSGRGEAFQAGSKVVKNVTGFDLCKLLSGSWGMLAVLTEISVKVLPLPETSLTLALKGLEPQAACRAMALALGSPAQATGAAYLPLGLAEPGAAGLGVGSLTILRLEGYAATLSERCDGLRRLLTPFAAGEVLDEAESLPLWRSIGEALPLSSAEGPLWRVSTPVAGSWDLVAGLEPRQWFMDWAGGLIWIRAPSPPRPLPEDAHVQFWGGPEPSKANAFAFPEAHGRLLANIKAAFDPNDILNRGRMIPPLGGPGH